jgi:DNA helicase-2/ATP-dependent DNA helicase PcrA
VYFTANMLCNASAEGGYAANMRPNYPLVLIRDNSVRAVVGHEYDGGLFTRLEMPVTQQQIQRAEVQQHAAAHDPSPQVRLIAGPGSGKSFAIQERVSWLLRRNVPPDCIYVISFTRASTVDLRNRVRRYCEAKGQPQVDRVGISTLHSLALRALRAAGLLAYPADPLVMDDWELENVFDAEFSKASAYRPGQAGVGYTPSRCADIRRDYEAFCGTGRWSPPNYIPPDPPIADAERAGYQRFHTPRTQVYSCVLPGEIVRQCVVHMTAGTLNPAQLLSIQHLIVDEYQDLNPSDLEFVDGLIASGADTFVAGDDDQSIYSFRFASPKGIQSFSTRFPRARHHELTDCFRCTTEVLRTAQSLIAGCSEPNRIPKNLVSVYTSTNPPEQGMVHRWQFPSAVQEAKAIASSCQDLITSGIPAREIMILISNTRSQLSLLTQALEAANVEFESPRTDCFIDTHPGRFILALLRVVCQAKDYVAHRLLLGLRPHVGPGICNGIAEAVISSNVNFRDIFYQPVPAGVFRGAQLTVLNHARSVCAQISNWQPTETLATHAAGILDLVSSIFGQQVIPAWQDLTTHLPPDLTLEELRDYLWADTDEQRASLLEAVYTRLGMPIPAGGLLPPKVRIMTMHGAKGLNASITFIPGLMEEILPGERRRLYPGLVLESARMLYVSITRARAACILSLSRTRIAYGQFSQQTPSRFAACLAGPFIYRNDSMSAQELGLIVQSYRNL